MRRKKFGYRFWKHHQSLLILNIDIHSQITCITSVNIESQKNNIPMKINISEQVCLLCIQCIYSNPQTSRSFRVIRFHKTRAHRDSAAYLSTHCQSVVCFWLFFFFIHALPVDRWHCIGPFSPTLCRKVIAIQKQLSMKVCCFLHTLEKISIYGKNIEHI